MPSVDRVLDNLDDRKSILLLEEGCGAVYEWTDDAELCANLDDILPTCQRTRAVSKETIGLMHTVVHCVVCT